MASSAGWQTPIHTMEGLSLGNGFLARQRLTGTQKASLRGFQEILPEPPGFKAKAIPAQKFVIVILFRMTQPQLCRNPNIAVKQRCHSRVRVPQILPGAAPIAPRRILAPPA